MQSDMRCDHEQGLMGASRRADSVAASALHAVDDVFRQPLMHFAGRRRHFGDRSSVSTDRTDNDNSALTEHWFKMAEAREGAEFASRRPLSNAVVSGLFEKPSSFAADKSNTGPVIAAQTNTVQPPIARKEDHETSNWLTCLSPRSGSQNGFSNDAAFGVFSPTLLNSSSACFGSGAIEQICGTPDAHHATDGEDAVAAVNTEDGRSAQQVVSEARQRARRPPLLEGASAGCVRRTSWPTVHAPYSRPGNPHSSPRSAGDSPAKRWSFDASARLVDPVDGTFYNIAEEVLVKQDCSVPPARADAMADQPFCPPRVARNPDIWERGGQPQAHAAETTFLLGSSSDAQLVKVLSPNAKRYGFNLNGGASFEAPKAATACSELAHSSKDPKKLSLYKTELCRSFEETGSCRYGPKCQFAHGTEELRSVERHPKHKSVMCKTFWEKGSCPYGQRCCFIHTLVPSEKGAVSIQSRAVQANVSNGGSEAARSCPPLSGKSAVTVASLASLYRLEDDAVNATINARVVAPKNGQEQPADIENAAGSAWANRKKKRNTTVASADDSEHFTGWAKELDVSSEISAGSPHVAADAAYGAQDPLQPHAKPGRPARFAAGGVRRLPIFQSIEL